MEWNNVPRIPTEFLPERSPLRAHLEALPPVPKNRADSPYTERRSIYAREVHSHVKKYSFATPGRIRRYAHARPTSGALKAMRHFTRDHYYLRHLRGEEIEVIVNIPIPSIPGHQVEYKYKKWEQRAINISIPISSPRKQHNIYTCSINSPPSPFPLIAPDLTDWYSQLQQEQHKQQHQQEQHTQKQQNQDDCEVYQSQVVEFTQQSAPILRKLLSQQKSSPKIFPPLPKDPYPALPPLPLDSPPLSPLLLSSPSKSAAASADIMSPTSRQAVDNAAGYHIVENSEDKQYPTVDNGDFKGFAIPVYNSTLYRRNKKKRAKKVSAINVAKQQLHACMAHCDYPAIASTNAEQPVAREAKKMMPMQSKSCFADLFQGVPIEKLHKLQLIQQRAKKNQEKKPKAKKTFNLLLPKLLLKVARIQVACKKVGREIVEYCTQRGSHHQGETSTRRKEKKM